MVFLSRNQQRQSGQACPFIVKQAEYCRAQEKGKAEGYLPDNPPTRQWQCNWLEGSSIFLDPPVMLQVIYSAYGCRNVAGHVHPVWLAGTWAQTVHSCLSSKSQHGSNDREGKLGCSPMFSSVWAVIRSG